jgi:hypothetical protein
MSWFTRRKPRGQKPTSLLLETGPRPSPGIQELCRILASAEEPAVLDLGSSSTENVTFLSRFSEKVTLHDLYRSASGEAGARSQVFHFDDSVAEHLPEGAGLFDAVLLWDLLHYFGRESFELFSVRLAELCRPGALVYAIASNHAKLPQTPIHFKILGEDSLHYEVPPGERASGVQLTTREVERRMALFEPLRLFQLRNGLQEFLFRYPPPKEEPKGGPITPQNPPPDAWR